MKQTVIATFPEMFGDVEIFFEHNFFSLVSLEKVQVRIRNKAGVVEVLPGKPERIDSFNHYQILKQIHKYQLERRIQAILIGAEGYKELEKLILKYKKYPFTLFIQINKKILNKLYDLTTAKSIALVDEVEDISDYKDIFIFGNISADEIMIENQNLTFLFNASCNIKGKGNSFVTIERKFLGSANVDHLALGPNCDFQGNIRANKLMLNIGCKINGRVAIGEK